MGLTLTTQMGSVTTVTTLTTAEETMGHTQARAVQGMHQGKDVTIQSCLVLSQYSICLPDLIYETRLVLIQNHCLLPLKLRWGV